MKLIHSFKFYAFIYKADFSFAYEYAWIKNMTLVLKLVWWLRFLFDVVVTKIFQYSLYSLFTVVQFVRKERVTLVCIIIGYVYQYVRVPLLAYFSLNNNKDFVCPHIKWKTCKLSKMVIMFVLNHAIIIIKEKEEMYFRQEQNWKNDI